MLGTSYVRFLFFVCGFAQHREPGGWGSKYSEAPVMFRGKSREGLGYRYYLVTAKPELDTGVQFR